MREWRTTLKQLLATEGRAPVFPLEAYRVRPPLAASWPENLPSSRALRDFYETCNGGRIGSYHFQSLRDLNRLTTRWVQTTDPWDGIDLTAEKQTLFAENDEGWPLVWDASTQQVSLLDCEARRLVPLADSSEAFFERLFNPVTGTDELWEEALELLDARGADDA